MKKLQKMRDDLEGWSVGNMYGINVEYLWLKNSGTERFIYNFGRIIEHEFLHYAIEKTCDDMKRRQRGEEWVIGLLMNRPFSKKYLKGYRGWYGNDKDDDKDSRGTHAVPRG